MKKLLLFFAAAVMAVSFNACSEETDPDDVKNPTEGDNNQDNDSNNNENIDTSIKLVKRIEKSSIQYPSTNVTMNFEYNLDNRITKGTNYYYTPFTYSYDGNKMTVTDGYSFGRAILNDDGTVAHYEFNEDGEYGSAEDWLTYDFRYKDGYFESVYDGGISLAWNDGNLTELIHFQDKYTFVYDENQPKFRPINIDIIQLIFSHVIEERNLTKLGISYWFLGKHSRLYPSSIIYYVWPNYDMPYQIDIEYEFNKDGSIATIKCIRSFLDNTSDTIFTFSY